MSGTTRRFPKIRKLAWKTFYGLMAWRFRLPEWSFMNYGYDNPVEGLALPARDEKNRYFIQLYAQALGQAGSVAGQDVLEVGCGRGGGSEWVARTQGVKSMTGMDLAGSAVRLCRARHHAANLTFVQGDAEKLPFPDASFDVVLNVESCHHYPSLTTFFREVARVLRPGGRFCVAVYGNQSSLRRFRQSPANTELKVVQFSDITPYVVSALKASDGMKMALIRRHAPWYLTPIMEFFAGVEGSGIHRGFAEGRLTYVTSLLRKPAAICQAHRSSETVAI